HPLAAEVDLRVPVVAVGPAAVGGVGRAVIEGVSGLVDAVPGDGEAGEPGEGGAEPAVGEEAEHRGRGGRGHVVDRVTLSLTSPRRGEGRGEARGVRGEATRGCGRLA